LTENANRKFAAATARIECCPYKLDCADKSVLQFPRLAVNPTRGKLAKFHVAKGRVHFLSRIEYRNYYLVKMRAVFASRNSKT